MAIYLVIIIFVIPLCAPLYIWRKVEPKRNIYYIIGSLSVMALVMLVLSGSTFMTFMGLGLFLASTSLFSGTVLSTFVRAYLLKKS